MKEVIAVLLPIFLGFVLTHAYLIVYGIPLRRRCSRTWCPKSGA